MNSALLVADMQIDFCPGGTLPVAEADTIIPIINKYCALFTKNNLSVFASRDWHPEVSSHFSHYGGLWPVHCVQNTRGAQFHPDLRLPPNVIVLSKGMDPSEDAYTAFQGKNHLGQSFVEILEQMNIRHLSICGVATDYCVRWSVLSGLEMGLSVRVLTDAIKGINLHPEDSKEAIEQMIAAGAVPMTFETFTF